MMITEDERFIKIQGILTLSDISPSDCIEINDLIIELSKENAELINQQQEFIKYLEDEITKLKKVKVSSLEETIGKDYLIKIKKEILQKYKEIVGNDTNVGTKGGNKDD